MTVRLASLGALVALIVAPHAAHAYARCDTLIDRTYRNVNGLEESFLDHMTWQAQKTTPATMRDMAFDIRPVTTDPERFFPYATFTAEGEPVVVITRQFTRTACSLVLHYYLQNEPGLALPSPARLDDAAHKCMAVRNDYTACLVAYAAGLESQTLQTFEQLPERRANLAYGLFQDAIYQILAHEVAHHTLNHFATVPDQLPRIDAEFEADFQSAVAAVSEFRPAHAAIYLFDMLETFETVVGITDTDHYSAHGTPLYETLDCRSRNMLDIITATGYLNTAIGSLVAGSADAGILERLKEAVAFNDARPVEEIGLGCGRLKVDFIRDARADADRLSTFVIENFAAFAANNPGEDMRASADFDEAKMLLPMLDLAEQSGPMATLIVDILATYVARTSQEDDFVLSDGTQGRLLSVAQAKGSSKSLGRLLVALAILGPDEIETAGSDHPKIRMLRNGVSFNPDAYEGWMQLALNAFYRRDCEAMLEYAFRAALTASEGAPLDGAAQLFTVAREAVYEGTGPCAN